LCPEIEPNFQLRDSPIGLNCCARVTIDGQTVVAES